jgi:hypothetical protein
MSCVDQNALGSKNLKLISFIVLCHLRTHVRFLLVKNTHCGLSEIPVRTEFFRFYQYHFSLEVPLLPLDIPHDLKLVSTDQNGREANMAVSRVPTPPPSDMICPVAENWCYTQVSLCLLLFIVTYAQSRQTSTCITGLRN